MIYPITGTILAVLGTILLYPLVLTSTSPKEQTYNIVLVIIAWANAIALWVIT